MKNFYKILIILLIFPFLINASEIYYCVEDAKVGLDPKNNYKSSNYATEKYTVAIDFENYSIVSDRMLFTDQSSLGCFPSGDVMYCVNTVGYLFAMHSNTLDFHLSKAFIDSAPTDDITIAHGKCEKF